MGCREARTMSIECAECERDLRGGHAIGCSRRRCKCDAYEADECNGRPGQHPCTCECHEYD